MSARRDAGRLRALLSVAFLGRRTPPKPPAPVPVAEDPAVRDPGPRAAAGLTFETFQTRLKGDLRIGGKANYPGAVLIVGDLTLEDESELEGALEVYGNVTLGPRARITQPLIVHGALVLGPDAEVRTCRVDGEVTLYRNATVEGELDCDALHLDERDVDWAHTAPMQAPQSVVVRTRPQVAPAPVGEPQEIAPREGL